MTSAADKSNDRKEGKRLTALRKSRGIKASWVADEMGVSNSFLCLLEAGKRHWNQEQVGKYLKAIGAK